MVCVLVVMLGQLLLHSRNSTDSSSLLTRERVRPTAVENGGCITTVAHQTSTYTHVVRCGRAARIPRHHTPWRGRHRGGPSTRSRWWCVRKRCIAHDGWSRPFEHMFRTALDGPFHPMHDRTTVPRDQQAVVRGLSTTKENRGPPARQSPWILRLFRARNGPSLGSCRVSLG